MGAVVKQPEDVKTVDMIDPLPPAPPLPPKPKRGRPPGDGKTSAQRQKERRERLKAQGITSVTVELPSDVYEALKRFVQFKDETQSDAVIRILRDRLLRKR